MEVVWRFAGGVGGWVGTGVQRLALPQGEKGKGNVVVHARIQKVSNKPLPAPQVSWPRPTDNPQ